MQKKCKKMQKKCKKMQFYLHMSKKSSTFVADLGIVPVRTIKYNRVMRKECVFKVVVEGRVWKVIKYPKTNCIGAHLYKIEHNRRVFSKAYRLCAQLLIVECLRAAFGCDVHVRWGIVS